MRALLLLVAVAVALPLAVAARPVDCITDVGETLRCDCRAVDSGPGRVVYDCLCRPHPEAAPEAPPPQEELDARRMALWAIRFMIFVVFLAAVAGWITWPVG